MPRIPKPKVGNPVWMKNFGFVKYGSHEVAETDWVEGVIVEMWTFRDELAIKAKFDGHPTLRTVDAFNEDYLWVYRESAPTCATTQISFIPPRGETCHE